MNIRCRRAAALAAVLPVVGCGLLQGQPQKQPPSDPWVRVREFTRDPEQQAQQQQALRENVTGANPESQTTLERLQQTTRDLQLSKSNVSRLEQEVEALTGTIEQLRKDNQSMQEFVDSIQTDRDGVASQLENLQEDVAKLQADHRALAEELLAERIQRVRVERELILAKIAEADRVEDE